MEAEQSPYVPMEKTGKIIRRSIYTFLQKYQYFTTISVLLACPFSLSLLLSLSLLPSSSSLLPTIHRRLSSLFAAAGFPHSSEFFTILNLKLSQTITSSVLILPFTLSFLLFAKTTTIQALNPSKQPFFATFTSIYPKILHTHLCNSLLIISANATCFSILFLGFNFLEGFGYSSPTILLFASATGAVIYSVIIANTITVCNLALVSSGIERVGGFLAILKACVLIRGRTALALSLTLPLNLALAAIEALFHYRVVRAYHHVGKLSSSMAMEGMFIAYMYSIFIVLDTIVGCVFFRVCNNGRAAIVANGKIFEEIP